jgi:hypothetical protein
MSQRFRLVSINDLILAFLTTRNLQQVSAVTKARGLKGSRKLQGFGGLSIASASTDGKASSVNFLQGVIAQEADGAGIEALATEGVTGTGLVSGTSFGSSNSYSPGFGNSQATGAANGFGNSTSAQVGGVSLDAGTAAEGVVEALFGNGFGDFDASGGGTGTFGSPLAIPGTGSPATDGTAATEGSKNGGATDATPGTPAVPPLVVPGLQTGGGGGGFGFTFGGGIGNVSGDISYSEAYGTAQSAGFGSGQGQSLFGTAGGSGGGTSLGGGGGNADTATIIDGTAGGIFGVTTFNGTGGGIASGGAGAYVGFNPNTPVILGVFPLGGP